MCLQHWLHTSCRQRNMQWWDINIILATISWLSLDCDECVLGTSSCSQLCNNTIGSYVCGCNTGYTLGASNITCDGEVLNVIIWLLQNIHVLKIDIDECRLGSSNCTQLCSNTIGSYLCGCNNGYILGMDNITCNGKTLIYTLYFVNHCILFYRRQWMRTSYK